MKKVRLLCLLALLFAVGSAFTTTKFEKVFYRVSDGEEGYFWVDEEPIGLQCTADIELPCSYIVEENAVLPEPNVEPDPGDIIDDQGGEGGYE